MLPKLLEQFLKKESEVLFMPSGIQTQYGKAFEYACLLSIYERFSYPISMIPRQQGLFW